MLGTLPHFAHAQDFINNDLDGVLSGLGSLPFNWSEVPFTDPTCQATWAFGSTPDLADLTGPAPSGGNFGSPHSSGYFVSALHSAASPHIWQEGIMQTVSGFSPGCSYSIGFYQAVVKQINCLDPEGAWKVFLDNTLIGTTAISSSNLPYDNVNLTWDFRQVSFIATSSTHTIKFLAYDPDGSINSDFNEGIRMGIDSIYLEALASGFTPIGGYIQDTVLCQGDTLNIDAGAYADSYLWQDGSMDSVLSITQPGTYWVQATASCGTFVDTIIVSPLLTPSIDLGPDTSTCSGDFLTLQAVTIADSFLWQNGATSPTLNASQAGLYWVQANNACGAARDSINLTITPLPVVVLGGDTILCTGQTVTLDASTSPGSYAWQDGSSQSSFQVSSTGTYWVDVTQNGCSNGDTIQVNYQSYPTLDLGTDTSICQGSSIILDASYPGATYHWQNGTTANQLTIDQTGVYWVESSLAHCAVVDTIDITVQPLPYFELGADTSICQGDSLTLDASVSGVTYMWSNTSTSPTLTVGQPGEFWAATSLNGCSYSDTIHIDMLFPPSVDLGNDTTLCEGDSLLLSVDNSNATVTWQDGSIASNFTVVDSGLYLAQALNTCGIYLDTIVVNFNPRPEIDLGPTDTTVCEGEVLILDATYPGATHSWNIGGSEPFIPVTQANHYWVEVTLNGCTSRDSIYVDFIPLPTVNLGEDRTICFGKSLTLNTDTGPGIEYLWSDSSSLPNLTVLDSGSYWVEVQNSCGTVRDSILISQTECSCDVFVPNAFTPNGDGVNDVFGVHASCEFTYFRLSIYNRYGEIIFTASPSNETWDGSYQQLDSPDGIYIWCLEYSFENNLADQDKRGHVTVLR